MSPSRLTSHSRIDSLLLEYRSYESYSQINIHLSSPCYSLRGTTNVSMPEFRSYQANLLGMQISLTESIENLPMHDAMDTGWSY
jgi:hypothetical protein